MIRSVLLLAFLLAPLSTSVLAAKSTWIQPTSHAGKVDVLVSGNSSRYYLTTKQRPIVFELTGPTPVRVLSRIVIDSLRTEQSLDYRLCVEIDKVRLFNIDEKADVSSSLLLPDSLSVGTLEREAIYIPRGKHKVWLFPERDSLTVGVRLLLGERGRSSNRDWKELAPVGRTRPTVLQTEDADSSVYYFFDAKHPVFAKINGPIQLSIQTRLDFVAQGPTTQSYRVDVEIDGVLVDSFRYEAEPEQSSRNGYYDRRSVIPGKLKRTRSIDLPKGLHEISVTLKETTAPGATLQILHRKQPLDIG